ncbi:MAG: DUF2431 domain-containing protein [archaeon]|nr:DUF2431 domain-containing protein [archaeon]
MIYPPREDSHFLSETIKKNVKHKEITALDMGTGSGIQAETLNNLGIKKENILCVDINKEAVKFVKKKGFNCIYSDLFSKIKNKFDLIVFNPPYLPEHELDKEKDTSGGRKGNEVIIKFLRQAREHLNQNGKILLLTSNLTPRTDFEKIGYKSKMIAVTNLFFEELYVWELRM